MQKNGTIWNELNETSPLLTSIGNKTPYSVPTGYFNSLSDEIANRIKIEEVRLSPNTKKPYTVPENYFEGLAASILAKIKQQPIIATHSEVYEELEEIAPLLNTINKEIPFAIPVEYFNRLNIIAPKAKVITLNSRHIRKWMSYTAAAMIAGMLVTGAYLYTERPAKMDLGKEVQNLSNEELLNSMDNSVQYGATDNVTTTDLPDVKESLQSVSDEELQQYFKDNNTDVVDNTSSQGS